MRLATGAMRDICVDTDEVLTAAACRAFKTAGIAGVWRYLSDLTPAEVNNIISAGLILYFVNHARRQGWIPSGVEGAQDAARDLADLKRLGIPTGVHVAFDLEGVGGGNPQLVIEHVSTHARGIQASKNLAALYVGDQALLTSQQLYALPSTLYWHSCSRVADISDNEAGPECGWAVYQGFPPDQILAGVKVDYNVIFRDFRGRAPIGVAA